MNGLSLPRVAAATGFMAMSGLAAVFGVSAAPPVAIGFAAGAAITALSTFGLMTAMEKQPSVSLLEDWKNKGKGRLAFAAVVGGLMGGGIGGAISLDAKSNAYLDTLPVFDPDAVVETVEVKAREKWCDSSGRRQEIEFNGQKFALSCK